MRAMHSVRVGVSLAALVIGCGAMSGCLSSPTYGTDKTAGVQLLDDLGDIASVSAATPKEKGVKYPNRPGLVVGGDKQTLTAPQQSLASKDNPAWLESPEDARKRLASEADEKKNDVNYRSPLAQADSSRNRMTEAQQTAAYRAARQDQAGTYDQRRYLIDPPQQYRQVSDPSALNDLGTPESKKEKQRKKDAEAAQQTNNSSWWKPFQ
ncbi:hypothetical protein HGP17_25985 [Rhizobium sp. P38BS-XIX]|uniref:hypothetical protein n=1 Tax=Rhizobium sp. P38BS-XIX TaxID=2726740 RepID=UPI001456905B|nr:hypothetical protein [Rhizobium sp. P38BS-XIX]NLS00292.1 hypothetical protein [Rhizobium sp. P38BS-XIX]